MSFFDDGVVVPRSGVVPVYRVGRRFIVVDSDVVADPHEVEYVSFYEWRPWSLFSFLVGDVGLSEDVSEKIVRVAGGRYDHVAVQGMRGSYIVGVKRKQNIYHVLYGIDHGVVPKYYDGFFVPRDVFVRALLGIRAWTMFGRPVDFGVPKQCGCDFFDGGNRIGVGLDIRCFHDVTGFKYRFVVGSRGMYRCGECPFRDVCSYLYFHPSRCGF